MIKKLIYKWEHKLARRDNNRVVRPFEWGLEHLHDNGFGYTDLHVNGRSERDILFEFNERAIAESHKFFSAPKTTEFAFDGEWLTFRSAVKTPYAENNQVHARFFPVLPRSEQESDSPAEQLARAKRRAVLVLPHWNAKIDEHVALCRLLNRIGIAALRITLPYHDRRMLPGFERADYIVSANVGRTLQSNRQAVLDCRAAIDWLQSQGYERIGILGTSLGSCIAFLTFIHEERIRAGVYNHVSSFFGDVVWEGITTAHVRRGLEQAINREELRRAWLAISPNAYVKRLAENRRHGLLISAQYDLSFTPQLSQLLFEECDRHGANLDRAIVPCGHYTLGKLPYKYYAGYLILNYFRKHL
ncbi:MAG: abhydrolase domain-containing 18 [Acidobacteriota bacterium]